MTSVMSFLQSSPLLSSLTLNHRHDGSRSVPGTKRPAQGQLPLASTLTNLILFARDPVGIASEAVEDWYDGSTKEDRVRKQVLADRKQVLYLKLHTVSFPFQDV